MRKQLLFSSLTRHTRLLLAWLLLALGVAVASPLVQPQAMQIVCSADGAKLVASTEDGAPQGGRAMLDCPLCATPGAPPPAWGPRVPPAPSHSQALAWPPATPRAQPPAHAWRARGPPAMA